MYQFFRPLLFCFLVIAFVPGCEHADPLEPGGLEPTLSSIQENIFNTSCAVSNCHAGSNPPEGLDLSEGEAYANIVNVASGERPDLLRIDPGDPDNSYLVMKIEGAAGIVGQRMPFGRSPLSSEQISTIRQWVADGAQDN